MYPSCKIYYKFSTNREINNRILQACPPDYQQKLICKRLGVPTSLWSFYVFKNEIIYDSLVPRRSFLDISRRGHFRVIWFFDEESIENHAFSEYRDMKLLPEEKFFIFYHRDIDRYRRDCFCFVDTFPSLQTLCLRRIADSSDPIDSAWLPFLPKVLISRIENEKMLQHCMKMPKYNPTFMNALFFDTRYSLNELFSEIDTYIFSKEFVVWFQKDPIVSERFRVDCPIRTIYFHFKRIRSHCSTIYKFCLRCMQRCWDLRYKKKPALKRLYYLHDVSFSDQLKKIRNRCHWCAGCKRVPLFQILSPEEYVKEYGDGWPSKEEIFL